MALTGIQIFKYLSKKNCGECGVPTCLAFAMNLAAGKAELEKCPYITEEAKQALAEASAPPIRTVQIGASELAKKIGGELVMFRHEKRFENPPILAVLISEEMSDQDVDGRIQRFKSVRFVRIGLKLNADMIAVRANNPDKMKSLVEKAMSAPDALIMVMSENVEALKVGAQAAADRKPLVYAITPDNLGQLKDFIKEKKFPVVAKAKGLNELADLTQKLNEAQIQDIVLDSSAKSIKEMFEHQVVIRRLALLNKFRPLGYPTVAPVFELSSDPLTQTLHAATFISKYSGVIVLSDIQGEILFPLLLARLNVYTDPQRPMVTEPGVYDFSNPDAKSPTLVTSNFSLTYFIVSGEIENSRVPCRLVVVDTEGLSVMTAWAAGKFSGDLVGIYIKKLGLPEKLQTKKFVIPGLAAAISGELEEELGSTCEVLIGPREASHIPAYLKEHFSTRA